jgi:GDPmannose 4,6-dehydratase
MLVICILLFLMGKKKMKNKNVIITGIGQDGYFLSKQLLDEGYYVVGIDRWQDKGYSDEYKELMANENFKLIEGDITDRYMIRRLLENYQPLFFFNTAAISHVGVSFEIPERVTEVNYLAVLNILEELRAVSPETGFLQCSTSEQFGDNTKIPQDENSAMMPNSPYSIAKTAAYNLVKLYRNYGLKTYNTISFNHESKLRPENFVTRKITKALTNLKKTGDGKLVLGNIDTYRDWGHAPDFTNAMIQIVKTNCSNDYVLCTGETHTVREFVEETCNVLGFELRWEGKGINEIGYINNEPRIFISKEFYRPAEVQALMGSNHKIQTILGWQPTTTFKELVKIMVEHDLK